MTRADRGKPGWSARHEEIERIGEKLTELWLTNSKLTLEKLLAGIEPNLLFRETQYGDFIFDINDDEVEWGIDHYNDDPGTGN